MWNHYETVGPRSNNHVEGYNLKLNRYVSTVHPNVLNLIQDLRDLESFFAINYIQRKNGCLSKSFRRALDIKRDDILFNLKTLLFYNSISLKDYLAYASRLFSYDQNVELSDLETQEPVEDIYSYLDKEMPIDLGFLQNKSFEYIKNYVSLNKSQFIDLTKFFRGLFLPLYNDQPIDIEYSDLAERVSQDFVPIYTSPNGNCLFNAISINLYGSESQSLKIKLASLFICFEYEKSLRDFVIKSKFRLNFETLVLNLAKIGEWGCDFNLLTSSLLLARPVYSYSFFSNNSLFSDPFKFFGKDPVVLFNKDSHFVAALRLNYNSKVSIPRCNQLNFVDTEFVYYDL